VIDDRTVYDVRYSCRPLLEIAVVSVNMHLFSFKVKTAFDAGSLLLTFVSF